MKVRGHTWKGNNTNFSTACEKLGNVCLDHGLTTAYELASNASSCAYYHDRVAMFDCLNKVQYTLHGAMDMLKLCGDRLGYGTRCEHLTGLIVLLDLLELISNG
jgi:hypothetical protein